jgi:hypothetical protein
VPVLKARISIRYLLRLLCTLSLGKLKRRNLQ